MTSSHPTPAPCQWFSRLAIADRQAAVGEQLGRGYRESGFINFVGHGVAEAPRTRLRASSRMLFRHPYVPQNVR